MSRNVEGSGGTENPKLKTRPTTPNTMVSIKFILLREPTMIRRWQGQAPIFRDQGQPDRRILFEPFFALQASMIEFANASACFNSRRESDRSFGWARKAPSGNCRPNSTLSLERMDGLISPSEGLKGPSERANGSAGERAGARSTGGAADGLKDPTSLPLAPKCVPLRSGLNSRTR
jgi:hypothetical protein